MVTQERIRIEAENFLKGLDLPQNTDKQLIFDAFRNGMSMALMLVGEGKEQWLEGACNWLRNNLYEVATDYKYYLAADYEEINKFINDFRQANK